MTAAKVWILHGEFEEGSRNGEVMWVEGVYATQASAVAALKAVRDGDCENDDHPHCFCEEDHDHDECGRDCDRDGYWCHRCSQGYETNEYEVTE